MVATRMISIVDDDDSIRESVKSLMRAVGFRADVFDSAEAFLNSDRLGEADCLIVDVRMPGMGGLELQRHLMASNRHIPIIFITAHGDEEARLRALNAGAVEFLYKPFSEDALLAAVSSALKTQGWRAG
jgi:FixJ family two-component response regulator